MKTELKRNHFQQLASKQHPYKLLSLIICLLLSVGLKAQTVTINVETAGTLSSLIASSKKYLITNLKLTGNLNGTDIRYIREMAGSGYSGTSSTKGKLATLDLSDANILSGGVNYYYYFTTSYFSQANTIGNYTFDGCTSLASVTIPNSVTSIGDYAFQGCSSLTSVTIGNSVTSIGFAAFYVCTSLASVTIPNSVTSIGDCAFIGCTNLASVTIGNSVTSIGYQAFSRCTSLASVTIPNSVTSIGDAAFSECTSLTSVTIPNSVTSIGVNSFYKCTSLASVTIPNSVTSIGGGAFGGCTSLASVTIGNSVTSIGYQAFYGCTKLNKFIVPNENANYSAIDGVFFNKKATTLISYPNAKGSTYTIPNSVTSIGDYAFSECTSLTSVTIPNSVTSIGVNSFYKCTSLASVTIPNSVTSIGSTAFSGCTKLTEIHCKKATPMILASDATCFSGVNKSTCKLYVPKGSYSSYWAATIWGDFLNIIEENDTDGINTITSDDLSISSSSEGININSDKTIEASLYNVSGQCVYKGTISGEVTIPVENGLYIAKVGDKTFKVQK